MIPKNYTKLLLLLQPNPNSHAQHSAPPSHHPKPLRTSLNTGPSISITNDHQPGHNIRLIITILHAHRTTTSTIPLNPHTSRSALIPRPPRLSITIRKHTRHSRIVKDGEIVDLVGSAAGEHEVVEDSCLRFIYCVEDAFAVVARGVVVEVVEVGAGGCGGDTCVWEGLGEVLRAACAYSQDLVRIGLVWGLSLMEVKGVYLRRWCWGRLGRMSRRIFAFRRAGLPRSSRRLRLCRRGRRSCRGRGCRG